MLNAIRNRYRSEGLSGVLSSVAHHTPLARNPMPWVLRKLARQSSFTIVQVGAYTGDSFNDPLCKFLHEQLIKPARGHVLVIEPVKDYFEQLKANYRGLHDVSFENVAIAEAEGEHEFYRLGVDPTAYGQPEWLSQLGSLREDRMTALWNSVENFPEMQSFYLANRITEKVRCMTLSHVFERHDIRDVDLLQIDTEGYDYQILKTIDFSQIRPRFINYERTLLLEQEPDCRAMLRNAAYFLVNHDQDTLAIRYRS